MPRLGRGDQELDLDEEEGYNPGPRRGVSCFFADDTTAVTPVAAATTTTAARRRPFSERTTRRRDDVGRKRGASAGGEQSAACARGGRCCAPRTAALLRTVQRGDYGTLTKLLSQSNRFVRGCCVPMLDLVLGVAAPPFLPVLCTHSSVSYDEELLPVV